MSHSDSTAQKKSTASRNFNVLSPQNPKPSKPPPSQPPQSPSPLWPLCPTAGLPLPSLHRAPFGAAELSPFAFELPPLSDEPKVPKSGAKKLKTLQVRLCFIFLLKQQEFLCNRSILFLSAKTWRCHMSTHVLQGHLQGGGLLAGSLFQLGFQCHQSILPFRLSRDLDPTWKMLAFKNMVLFHLNCDRLGTKFGTKLASLLSHLESRDIKKGT